MLSYINIFLGPLYNMSVYIVVHNYGVVGVVSPIQLKPWTKPVIPEIFMAYDFLKNKENLSLNHDRSRISV